MIRENPKRYTVTLSEPNTAAELFVRKKRKVEISRVGSTYWIEVFKDHRLEHRWRGEKNLGGHGIVASFDHDQRKYTVEILRGSKAIVGLFYAEPNPRVEDTDPGTFEADEDGAPIDN